MSRNVPAERLRERRYHQRIEKPRRGKGSFRRDKSVSIDTSVEFDEGDEECNPPETKAPSRNTNEPRTE